MSRVRVENEKTLEDFKTKMLGMWEDDCRKTKSNEAKNYELEARITGELQEARLHIQHLARRRLS